MNNKVIIALVIVVILAGCTTGDGLNLYDSPKPQVDNETLNQTNYTYESTDKLTYNKTINSSVGNYTVSVDSYLATYNRNNTGTLVPRSVYGLLSTPSVSPSGVELNPIVVNPTEKISQRVNESYSEYNLKVGDKINESNVSTRYNNTTIETYNSSIIVNEADARINSRIVTAVIETNKSVLVGFAMYPTAANDNSKQQEYAEKMIKNSYHQDIS